VSCESLLVVIAIDRNMKLVLRSKFSHHFMNVLHSMLPSSHRLSGEVSVAAWAIPFWEQFWSKGYVDIVVLCNTTKQPTGDPQLVSDRNTMYWTNLIFPLTWHDFGICARNLDTCIQTRFVVSIRYRTTKCYIGTNWTIVGALSAWVTITGPTERLSCELRWFTA